MDNPTGFPEETPALGALTPEQWAEIRRQADVGMAMAAHDDGTVLEDADYWPKQLAAGAKLRFLPGYEIEPTVPIWLWHLMIAKGQFQTLVGKKGWGKSTLAAWLIGHLSSGTDWPDGTQSPRVHCALFSFEETDHGYVKSRLDEAGADPEMYDILTDVQEVDDEGRISYRMWELPRDLPLLEALIQQRHYDYVFLDGLGYVITGDSHNYANVGGALIGVAAMAGRTGAAIHASTHTAKAASDGGSAAIGSYAWTTVPRIVWLLGKDPTDDREDDDPEVRRAFAVRNSNYKMPPNGYTFQVEQNEREVPYAANVTLSMAPAEDIICPSPGSGDIIGWLHDLLSQGTKTAQLVKEAAEEQGISWVTLKRYKRAAGAESYRDGFGDGAVWCWRLAPKGITDPLSQK